MACSSGSSEKDQEPSQPQEQSEAASQETESIQTEEETSEESEDQTEESQETSEDEIEESEESENEESSPEASPTASGQLNFEEKFTLQGTDYQLPMTLADFMAIEGLTYDLPEVTEISGRTWGTQSLFLNKGETYQIQIVASLYNYSTETIPIEEAVVSDVNFVARPAGGETDPEEWKSLLTVDNGIHFGLTLDEYSQAYPLPPKDDVRDMDLIVNVDYDLEEDDISGDRIKLQFNRNASADGQTPVLTDIGIRVDDTQMALNKTNDF